MDAVKIKTFGVAMDAFANFDQALAELESVIGKEAFCLETAIGHMALMNVIDRRKERHRKTSHIYRYMMKHKLCELAA